VKPATGRPDPHRRVVLSIVGLACAVALVPAARATGFPPTLEGARAVVAQFAADASGDRRAAMARLRPSAADYRAVYREPRASKLEVAHKSLWESGQTIGGKAGQTELQVVLARTDDLIDGKPVAREFPGGYAQIVADLHRGLPIVRFRYVEPGKTSGMAFDGLVHVNGRWVFIPAPWRVE
jgi:hypothetical protein